MTEDMLAAGQPVYLSILQRPMCATDNVRCDIRLRNAICWLSNCIVSTEFVASRLKLLTRITLTTSLCARRTHIRRIPRSPLPTHSSSPPDKFESKRLHDLLHPRNVRLLLGDFRFVCRQIARRQGEYFFIYPGVTDEFESAQTRDSCLSAVCRYLGGSLPPSDMSFFTVPPTASRKTHPGVVQCQPLQARGEPQVTGFFLELLHFTNPQSVI